MVSSKKQSYKEQQKQRHRFLKYFMGFFALFVVYNLFVTFYISVWALDNDSMQPNFSAGDRIIFRAVRLSSAAGNVYRTEDQLPFNRGSIVIVDNGDLRNRPALSRFADTIVRFFTAQRVSVFSGERQHYLKRIVGLPGDEISMTNYVFRVRPLGSQFSLTEFELAARPYHPSIPQAPGIWDNSLPFSGNMAAFTLGPDEFFVISDDRSNTNDSRTWGPLPPHKITARAMLRFWPLTRFNLL